MSLRVTLILNFLCLLLRAFGQGGPPMITDDPGTVDKGHFEINSGISTEHTRTESLYEFPFIDINYGVSGRQHINFEVPLVSWYVQGDGRQTGFGNVGIGTKFRFIDQDKTGIDFSTHPALSFALTDDAADKGIIEEGTELYIPLEFQKDFNHHILGIEIGRLINSRSPGAWTYGVVYARVFNSRLNAAFEINGNSDNSFNETALFLNLGIRMSISKRFTMLFSGGKSMVLPDGMDNTYLGYLALQLSI